MKLFSRRTDNGFQNSRQVAKCPANLVHGIAGAKPAAGYDSPVTDFKSQLGYAQLVRVVDEALDDASRDADIGGGEDKAFAVI